jgi:threonine dehydrogenase-like Zn-dependent dehydrogenase
MRFAGFEAKGSALKTALTATKAEGSSGQAPRWCIAATRHGGVIGIPDVHAGFAHAFVSGDAFDEGIAFAMGQIHVQKLMLRLPHYIEDGELRPDVIISRHMALADAARGCENGYRTCLRAGTPTRRYGAGLPS